MRKGLVVTLGVVALVCVVSPGFALAPIISCVPDIIISDTEDNTQTDDLNFFIFSDALDLDDMVQDADDLPSDIRWSFLETSPGNSIRINGILSNTGSLIEPGAFDLRTVSQYATFENILWSGTATTETTMDSMITLVASDGTGSDTADIIVTTENNVSATPDVGPPNDGVRIPSAHSFLFDTQDNWEFYTFAGLTAPSASSAGGGSAQVTRGAAQTPIVYGTWESSKDPQYAAPLQARTGCVMRARYQLRSPDGQVSPGFRLRAFWVKVEYVASMSLWVTSFTDQDFNAEQQMVYATFDGMHIAGREPGTAGQEYTMLYLPEQTDTLETTGIIYLAFDMLDNDTMPGANDQGTLYVDQIDVDWIDNPSIGNGRAETAMSTTDFSAWVTGITQIAAGWNSTSLQISATASGISITVMPANMLFEAVARSPGMALESGRYYRVTYMVTSTQTPGGPFGPTVRAAINSLDYVYGCNKDLGGGGLLSAFDATPRPYQVWVQAPSPSTAGSSMTEDMSLIFESYLLGNPNPQFGKVVQGTVTCSEVITESWDPAQFPPAP